MSALSVVEDATGAARNKRGYTGKKVPSRRQTPEHYARSNAASARVRRTAAVERLLLEMRPLLWEQRKRLIEAVLSIQVVDPDSETSSEQTNMNAIDAVKQEPISS